MRKFATFFSLLVSFSLFADSDLPHIWAEDTVKINQFFKIYAEFPKPHLGDWIWTEEDEWKLISYPHDALVLLESEIMTRDYAWGVLQRWDLKARKAGTFNLIFKRHSESVAVSISILESSYTHEPVKVVPGDYSGRRIDLRNGDTYFVVEKGYDVWLKVPDLHAPAHYVWQPQDYWKLSCDKKIKIIRENCFPHPSYVCQDWQVKFDQAGVYTLTFTTPSSELVIEVRVED